VDAFRTIPMEIMQFGGEPRQTTSNIGHITQPNRTALLHGLDRHYYSLVINYRKKEFEQKMLGNLNKSGWTNSLSVTDFVKQHESNFIKIKELERLTGLYDKWIKDETKMKREEFIVHQTGKLNP
jgi:26S proteasome regulatory subunit N11